MNGTFTTAEREVRRRMAVRLLQERLTLSEVARCVEASESSVKRWKRAWLAGGEAALASKPHRGPACRLSQAQKNRLVKILKRGPLAAGYGTDLWTCARVREVIEAKFGVTYHVDHVGRLLHALGFTPQQPRRLARERDETAITRWREREWPRIKKGDRGEKLASSSSTNRAFSCSR